MLQCRMVAFVMKRKGSDFYMRYLRVTIFFFLTSGRGDSRKQVKDNLNEVKR